MRLLTAKQIRDWDTYTIQQSGITSLELMERAASGCIANLRAVILHQSIHEIVVFCGGGNNGGDGLVIARKLHELGMTVKVYVVVGNKSTPEFDHNLSLLPVTISLVTILHKNDLPLLTKYTLVVDALLGTGLNRTPEGIMASVIEHLNTQDRFVVSIDIPSGLPADLEDITSLANNAIIEADLTLTFQFPKISFTHAECAKYTGLVYTIDIGLLPEYLEAIKTGPELITAETVQSFYKPRMQFGHKGVFGHVLMVAGSYGKLGASILASKAVLRAGCGLVTAYVPKVGYAVLQTAVPEVMVTTDDAEGEIRIFPKTAGFAAVGVGPGLGTSDWTIQGFRKWIGQINQPVVIDADGLNMCAQLQADPSFQFPPNCIITPHPKEFDRLAGVSHNSFERAAKQKVFAQKHKIVVVLKGAYTCIVCPDGKVFYNSSGNVALATAGSGDVLTGIISSLLAQQYSLEEAAVFGVYLHGLCADRWVRAQNQTMLASDIIDMIPQALYRLFN
jgi:ADP-dependent NAD(P)H-hydrate dehydratase / NAD(P)H-hydrate epimerase